MDLTEKSLINNHRHPWELSRTKCILDIVNRLSPSSVIDIGAGDLYFLSELKPFISGSLYAIDKEYKIKAQTVDNIHLLNNISELPESESGIVILMDVLEHIYDDSMFLKETLEKTKRCDTFLITVPAFNFLFSSHDAFLKHHRRYNQKQLLSLIYSHNLHVERCHYFYTSLFLVRFLSCLLNKNNNRHEVGIGEWQFSKKHIVTKIIYKVLNIDFSICGFLARFNIFLPGLSLLAVCKRRKV